MRIGGFGFSEAAKWGETQEIQRSAQKTAEKAMTDGFISQIQEMAKTDAQKGVYAEGGKSVWDTFDETA